jgi:hypothetical protein
MAEMYYSLSDVKELWFPSRSARWIKDTFRKLAAEDAALFPILRDGSGWQISKKAVESYQSRHAVRLVVPGQSQLRNLRQFQST